LPWEAAAHRIALQPGHGPYRPTWCLLVGPSPVPVSMLLVCCWLMMPGLLSLALAEVEAPCIRLLEVALALAGLLAPGLPSLGQAEMPEPWCRLPEVVLALEGLHLVEQLGLRGPCHLCRSRPVFQRFLGLVLPALRFLPWPIGCLRLQTRLRVFPTDL
jgi:hypothetical protein